MILYILLNLIGIFLLLMSWRYTRTIITRMLSIFLTIISLISYNIIYINAIYVNNFRITNIIINDIQKHNYVKASKNLNKLSSFIYNENSGYLFDSNYGLKLLLKTIIDIRSNNVVDLSSIRQYLVDNVNSNVSYESFTLYKKVLGMIEISCLYKNQLINDSLYVNMSIHGFQNDAAYLQIINNLLLNNQKTTAIHLIRQLLTGSASRLSFKTKSTLYSILGNLI